MVSIKYRIAKYLNKYYENLSRSQKRRLLVIIDIFLFLIAITSAFALRFRLDPNSLDIHRFSWQIFLLVAIKLVVFQMEGMYRPVLRHTGPEFLFTAMRAVAFSSGIEVVLSYLHGSWPLPRTVLVIDSLITLILVVSVRALIPWLFHQIKSTTVREKSLVVIYGAGSAGCQLAQALQHEPAYTLVGFVDDNPELHHQMVQGVRVYSPENLPQLHEYKPFGTVILAMPSIDKTRRREIITSLEPLSVVVKTVPSLKELLSHQISVSTIRNVDVSELLGREEVLPDPTLLSSNITHKFILVTGAGGSIGSELCRQIVRLKPECLVLYELNEFSLYSIHRQLQDKYPQVKIIAYLGNVRDENYLNSIIRKHSINTIYHAAAYKHVPIVEENCAMGILNNIFGTLSVVRCAVDCGVDNFVLISTDKAVRPTNVMGASKRVAELIIQAFQELPEHSTCFAIVRFGNVLDSSGSVVPLFREQIAQGKPITITHPEMTRYFMSIPEAVRLVIQAGAMAKGGEVFLLDMGEPIRIYDLAVQMIRLSGLVPGVDIPIEITGLRPGEKLYEELLIDGQNAQATQHPKIFCSYEQKFSWIELESMLEVLLTQAILNNRRGIIEQLKILVPEYQPPKPNNYNLVEK